MNILILVLSLNDNNIYTQFYKKQKETWDSINVDGVKTMYYFGDAEKNFIDNENIHTDIKEKYFNIGYKTLTAFDLVKNLEFDYIFRTNSSSYVDKELLVEFLKNKPKEKFYSGLTVNYRNNGLPFASGSGYFLSKDLFDHVLKNKNQWNHQVIDDVSMGIMMIQNYIKIYEGKRFDLTPEYPENFNNIDLNHYHYRFKTDNRLKDIENIQKMYARKINCVLKNETI